MERRPELTIIAGPNGAGKSRLCPFYVSVKSFDGDKLMLDLRREHPEYPENVFVCGDAASGASLVVRAIASGKQTAEKVHAFLQGK